MIKRRFFIFSKIYYALFFIILICIVGVIGFMNIEGYSLMNAVYMTVITVSTVGFQEVVELSENGRLFTTFLITASFGTFAYSVSVVTTYVVSGDFNKYFIDYMVKKEIQSVKNHTMVCGYGRNDSQAVDKLFAYNESFVVIDNNPQYIQKLRDSQQHLFVSGYATLDETLELAGISRAKALVSTLSSDADNVIMPNKLGGAHMASLVTTPDVIEFLDNITLEGNADINLEEISINSLLDDFSNKTVKDINVRFHTGCNIIGFKTLDRKYVINPGADTKLLPNSKLFVLGTNEQIKKLNNLLKNS